MRKNTPNHLQGIEGELNSYSNPLYKVPGYSQESYNSFLSEYDQYFKENPDLNPDLVYAKAKIHDEMGGEEYYKTNFSKYDNLDSLVRHYNKVGTPYIEPEDVNESTNEQSVDSISWSPITPEGTTDSVQIPYAANFEDKSDEEIFGNNEIVTKTFSQLHPEYNNLDLDSRVTFPGITGSNMATITKPDGKIFSIGNIGNPLGIQTESNAKKLEAIEYWVSRGMSRDDAAKMMNPGDIDYDYLDLLHETIGSEEAELKYLQENTAEAVNHYVREGYTEEIAQQEIHKRIAAIEEKLREKITFAQLDSERKAELVRQYKVDKYQFDNPIIEQSEGDYLFEAVSLEGMSVDGAANNILDKMVNGSYKVPQLGPDGKIVDTDVSVDTQKYIRMFDSIAADISNYYADHYKMGEFFMPAKDKLKVMSKFLALSRMASTEVALQYVKDNLPKYEGTPEISKGLKFLRTWGQQTASTAYSLWGIVEGTADWIAGNSSAPEGSGWLDRWLWSIGSTDAVQRSQLMSDTGLFVGFGDNKYYRQALEMQRYGANVNDLSKNKVIQFFANQGYTAVTMFYSSGATKLVSGTSKMAGKAITKGATKLATKSAFKWAGKITEEVATKWSGRMLAAGILPAVTAGNEALMEGNDAYRMAVQRGHSVVDKLVEEALKEDLTMDDFGNFLNKEVAEFFSTRTAAITAEIDDITKSLMTVPSKGELKVDRSSQIERLNALQDQLRKEYAYIAEEYKQYKYGEAIEQSKEAIEREAVNAYATTVALDAAIICTCDLFFSSVLGPTAGKLLGKLGVTSEKALIKPISENIADGFKATPYGAAVKTLGNLVSEGTEEYTMVLNREGALGLSDSNLARFFYNTVDPQSEEALGYNMFTSMAAIGNAVGDAAISKEAWEAFAQGALGALVGSMNTNVSQVSQELTSNLSVAKNNFERGMAWANALWRSPIFYEPLNRRHHDVRANAAVTYVNEIFEKNPELASAFQSAKGVGAYVNDFFAARERGDYVDAEDAEFGMFVSGANVLSKLENTAIGEAYRKYIKEILNTEANSEEGKNLIENFLSKLTDEERVKYEDNPEATLEEVKNRVREFQKLQKGVNSAMQDIDNTYGNLIDERTKEAIAFTYLARDNMKERIQSREEIIKSALSNEVFTLSERSTLNEEQQKVVAKYGSLENAVAALQLLQQAKAHRTEIKDARNAVKVFKSLNDANTVLSAADIIALNPVERAAMLNPGNLKLYSEDQRDVINALRKAGISKDVFTAIEEAGKIQSRLDQGNSIIEKLENSDLDIFKLNTALVKSATIKNANTKTELLKQADTFEEFKDGLDALIASGKLTVPEQAILGTSVFTDEKTKKFYSRYTTGVKVKESNNKLLDQMKPTTEDKRTAAVINAVLRALANRMTDFKDRFNFDDANHLFTEGGFLQTLKDQYGISWEAVTEGDKATILTEVKKAIDIANTAITNREEVFRRFNSEHPVVQVEQKPSDNKIFNDVIYNKAEALYNAIFDKLVAIQNGDRVTLSALELYQLSSLLNKNIFIAPLDVDPVLFKGLKVDVTSIDSLASLYESINKRKSFYEDSFSTYMQFLHGLSSLIGMSARGESPLAILAQGAIELNTSYKDKFDKKIKKETKKALQQGVKFDKRAKVVTLNIIPAGSPKLSETQKKWYEDNHIVDNMITVNERIPRKNIRTFLIKDPSLFESEVTYDSDNLPLTVAVEVGKHFPGAVQIDGKYYVYVGIVENSRENVTDDVNTLNIIRESALNDYNESDPRVITYSDTGKPIEFGGLTYNYAYTDGEVITSVKEKILRKYAHEKNEGKKLELAYQDFCNNTVRVHEKVEMNTVTEEVDGVTVTKMAPHVIWTYTWNGKVYHKEFDSTEDKHPFEREYEQLAYIMPNPESVDSPVVNLIFSNLYDLTCKDEEGNTIDLRSVYDQIMEGKMNLYDIKYIDSELSFLHNCLNDLRAETVQGKISGYIRQSLKAKNNKRAIEEKVEDKLGEKIQDVISGYLNTKPKGATASIQYKVSMSEGNLLVKLINPNLENVKPLYTASIGIEEFLENGDSVEQFFQEIVFNTFYDSDSETFREHEFGGNMIPLVKLQMNYKKFDGSDPKEKTKSTDKEDKRRGAFLSGILNTDGKWTSRELVNMSSVLREQKKEEQPQEVIQGGQKHQQREVKPPTPVETTVENALNILLNFKHTNEALSEARRTGHSGVTTFISTEERKEKKDMSAVEVLPFEVGTSLDFVVREFLRNKKDTEKTYISIYNAYKKLTTDTKHCPVQGLNWKELREYINNVKEFITFLEEVRGETVVPFDTLFTGKLETSDGRFANLTAIPDIITIDKKGQLHIYDMKSYRALDTTVKVPGVADSFFVARGAYFDKSIGLTEDGSLNHTEGSFQKQTSMYAHIVANATGLTVASVGIVPMPVYYDVDRSNLRRSESETDIPGLKVYQLSHTNGDQFRLKRTPKFYNNIINLPILPVDSISSNKWVTPESAIPQVLEGPDGDFIQPTGEESKAESVVPAVREPEGPKVLELDTPPDMGNIDPELQRMLEACGGENLGF